MAISVIRSPSTTPNITNSDDVRMFRFGVGNYDGYIPDRLLEFTFDASGKKINTGELVCQGWQVLMDTPLDLTSYLQNFGDTNVYYTAYIQIIIASTSTTATIHVSYSTSGYPQLDENPDVGGNTTGTLNIRLCNFNSLNGAITLVKNHITAIPYMADKISDIEERLDNLGFKQGSFAFLGETAVVKRQGNYIILTGDFSKVALPSGLDTSFSGTIPSQFRPKTEFSLKVGGNGYYTSSMIRGSWDGYLSIYTDGRITLGQISSHIVNSSGQSVTGYISYIYFSMILGYESPAI